MRSLFVMDPLSAIHIEGDSTYVTMRACSDRGFDVWMCTPDELYARDGRAFARATPVRTTASAPHFHPSEPVDLALAELDVVWMRKDPPFDMSYIFATYLLDMAVPHTLVVNGPAGLKLFNEKMWVAQRWPELQPPTLISNDMERLRGFASERGGRIVLKPWDGNGGRGVMITSATDRNLRSMVETLTAGGVHYVIAQDYVEAVERGDKRILLFDGEPVGAINRIPTAGDYRANMHVGARVEAVDLDASDLQICEALRPSLVEWGMVFVGIDVIGGILTEINVTSPTGIREINSLYGLALEEDLVDRVLAHVHARRSFSMIRTALLTVALALAAPAHADPDEPEATSEQRRKRPEQPDPTDAAEERVTGKAPPPLPRQPKRVVPPESPYYEYVNREFPPAAYLGATALKLEPAFVAGLQAGLEKLYLRDYPGTRAHFAALEEQHPGTGIRAMADVLVWQALMLENFDYRFDKQYWAASAQARSDLEAASKVAGREGWEEFLMTGVAGIESIHTMRQQHYINALQLAFEALDHLQKAREELPDFVDLTLADGMYNYWRTVVTMNSKVLPDFGDKRVEGIEQMQAVERGAVLIGPPTTMSLAFTWLEEGDRKRALSACVRNRRKYPDNIINNLLTGTTYLSMRRFDSALGVFDEILEDDPENRRVHYWKGLANLRSGKVPAARASFETYLGFDYMEDHQRAAAIYRLGQVSYREKDYTQAYEKFKEASKLGHKGAKTQLDRMKKKKKEGKIKY